MSDNDDLARAIAAMHQQLNAITKKIQELGSQPPEQEPPQLPKRKRQATGEQLAQRSKVAPTPAPATRAARKLVVITPPEETAERAPVPPVKPRSKKHGPPATVPKETSSTQETEPPEVAVTMTDEYLRTVAAKLARLSGAPRVSVQTLRAIRDALSAAPLDTWQLARAVDQNIDDTRALVFWLSKRDVVANINIDSPETPEWVWMIGNHTYMPGGQVLRSAVKWLLTKRRLTVHQLYATAGATEQLPEALLTALKHRVDGVMNELRRYDHVVSTDYNPRGWRYHMPQPGDDIDPAWIRLPLPPRGKSELPALEAVPTYLRNLRFWNPFTKSLEPKSPGLTPQEHEVLVLIANGLELQGIAEQFEVDLRIIKAHRKSIMKKLRLRYVSQITEYALEHGLVER